MATHGVTLNPHVTKTSMLGISNAAYLNLNVSFPVDNISWTLYHLSFLLKYKDFGAVIIWLGELAGVQMVVI